MVTGPVVDSFSIEPSQIFSIIAELVNVKNVLVSGSGASYGATKMLILGLATVAINLETNCIYMILDNTHLIVTDKTTLKKEIHTETM